MSLLETYTQCLYHILTHNKCQFQTIKNVLLLVNVHLPSWYFVFKYKSGKKEICDFICTAKYIPKWLNTSVWNTLSDLFTWPLFKVRAVTVGWKSISNSNLKNKSLSSLHHYVNLVFLRKKIFKKNYNDKNKIGNSGFSFLFIWTDPSFDSMSFWPWHPPNDLRGRAL